MSVDLSEGKNSSPECAQPPSLWHIFIASNKALQLGGFIQTATFYYCHYYWWRSHLFVFTMTDVSWCRASFHSHE